MIGGGAAHSGLMQRALREASITAALVVGLGALLIAFKAELGPNNDLLLVERPLLLASMTALTFIGRFFLVLWWGRARGAVPHQSGQSPFKTFMGRHGVRVLLLLMVALPVYLVVRSGGELNTIRYEIDLATLILTYVMLGWGLNIVVGLAGLLDLGYVAFYAVGAYSYALLAQHFGLSFWVCLPLAGILAAFWGILLGFPVFRLRGDYLAIVTLAFGEMIRLVLLNWAEFTGGPAGLSGIPRPSFFGLPFHADEGGFAATFGLAFDPVHRMIFFYYLIFALACVTYIVTKRLRRLPLGRAWEALREDEIACRSLGINTTTTKLTAFAIGAMFGGFAGAFFATRQGFISPESFNFMESALILAIVVMGGLGSQIGVALAAVVMIGGMEMLRELSFLTHIFGQQFDPTEYRMLIFGMAMVAMMIYRPRGFVSSREPTAYAHAARAGISASHVKEGHG
jgi:branched-chain amino acid transport system permease protein